MRGYNPRGKACQSIRLVDNDDGATISTSGHGLVVELKQGAEARRTFFRLCQRMEVVFEPVRGSEVEFQDGTFCHQTGKLLRDSDTLATVFHIIGELEALATVSESWQVERSYVPIQVRVPVSSGGSGELLERHKREFRGTRLSREYHEERKRLNRVPATSPKSIHYSDTLAVAHRKASDFLACAVDTSEMEQEHVDAVHTALTAFYLKHNRPPSTADEATAIGL